MEKKKRGKKNAGARRRRRRTLNRSFFWARARARAARGAARPARAPPRAPPRTAPTNREKKQEKLAFELCEEESETGVCVCVSGRHDRSCSPFFRAKVSVGSQNTTSVRSFLGHQNRGGNFARYESASLRTYPAVGRRRARPPCTGAERRGRARSCDI